MPFRFLIPLYLNCSLNCFLTMSFHGITFFCFLTPLPTNKNCRVSASSCSLVELDSLDTIHHYPLSNIPHSMLLWFVVSFPTARPSTAISQEQFSTQFVIYLTLSTQFVIYLTQCNPLANLISPTVCSST